MKTMKRDNATSVYRHYVNYCGKLWRLKEFAGQHKPQDDRPEEDVTESLAKTYKE